MTWEIFIKSIFEGMGFRDYRLEVNEEEGRAAVFIYEDEHLIKEHLPRIVESMNHIIQTAAKKNKTKSIFLDINNYRLEREKLIADLARAAGKKASATKETISLPVMNSYERRLVHTTLAIHPDVETESVGSGKGRYVMIRPIQPGQAKKTVSEETQNEAEL